MIHHGFLVVAILLAGYALSARAAEPATAPIADTAPFQFKQTEMMSAAPRAVFVAFMGDLRTQAGSGKWSYWSHAGNEGVPHDPSHVDANGRRDIASCFYPAIGPYDMSDPQVAEYHCQLLKMAGIDGISFNLSFFQRDPWRQKSMPLYVQAMRRYGLQGVVRFENKFYANIYPNHDEAIRIAYSDMDSWLKMLEPVQYRIGRRPVFMMFTYAFSPEELKTWLDRYPESERPIVVTFGAKKGYKGIIEGHFGWTGNQPNNLKDRSPYVLYVTPELMRENEAKDRRRAAELLDSGQIDFYIAGVSAGFDDIGCWGWGNGPRKVERDGGKTYQYRWEQLLRTNLRVVMIPTWNDWCEGTTIEPTLEYGDQYLAMTRTYGAQFKHAAANAGNLMLPVWIYKVRKTTTDSDALSAMSAASDAIAAADYSKAESLAKPWAQKLGVDRLTIWEPPAQK